MVNVRPDEQSWFWSEEWQAMEREADLDIAVGRIEASSSVDEFLDLLDS